MNLLCFVLFCALMILTRLVGGIDGRSMASVIQLRAMKNKTE